MGDKNEGRLQWLKEIVAAAIGLGVVGYTLYVTSVTLGNVDDAVKMTATKDILMLMLGLAGVVLGYYFGRLPADARAAQAQSQANDAVARARELSDKTAEAVRRIGETLDEAQKVTISGQSVSTEVLIEEIRLRLRPLA